MRRHLALLAAAYALTGTCVRAEEGSWIFRPSYYSHSPTSGERVAQYQPEAPAIPRVDPTYQESGYRHNHVSIDVGNSQDNLHVVQTWGQGDSIRPYGEWEYPFRAGATPFGPWGNPQGPWTLPFDSWQNPYGLMQHASPPYPQFGPYAPYQQFGPNSPNGMPSMPQGPWPGNQPTGPRPGWQQQGGGPWQQGGHGSHAQPF